MSDLKIFNHHYKWENVYFNNIPRNQFWSCTQKSLMLTTWITFDLDCSHFTFKIIYCIFSGKTALLFQYALSCAMDGQRVVFVTQKRLDSMPLFVDGAPKPDPILMKQVQLMWVILNKQSSVNWCAKLEGPLEEKNNTFPQVIGSNRIFCTGGHADR